MERRPAPSPTTVEIAVTAGEEKNNRQHDNCTPPSEFVIDVHQKAQNGSIIPRPKGKR